MNDHYGPTGPTATGKLATAGARPTVRLDRDLSDPPPTVWRALTDPEELKAWFPCEIVTERWEAGARLTFVFPENPEFTMTGTVLELDEPRLLVYTWGDDTLRFELTATESGGTRLVLTHHLTPGVAARTAAGWQLCLERLAGTVPPRDAWRSLFPQYAAAFEPELGPQEGPPAGFEDRA